MKRFLIVLAAAALCSSALAQHFTTTFSGPTSIRLFSKNVPRTEIVLPKILFGVLATLLVWISINVTNCADGVDGLSGTLTIITLTTIYLLIDLQSGDADFTYSIMLFITL